MVEEPWVNARLVVEVLAGENPDDVSIEVGVDADGAVPLQISCLDCLGGHSCESLLGGIEESPLQSILGMGVSESLDVVEDEPSQ